MRTRLLALLLASLAVLPMLTSLVWERGLPRLALSADAGLGALTAAEQPLTVRAFAGQWELLLVIAWFGLAYASRRAPVWEMCVVLLGAGLGLLRLGNLWLTGLLYAPALANRLIAAEASFGPLRRRGLLVAGTAAALCVVTLGSLVLSRPARLPAQAAEVVAAESGQDAVFADWRWAPALQHTLGSRPVLGANDVSPEYALDYLRVSLAHASWDTVLRQYDVSLVVLDAADTQAGAAAELRQAPDWRVALDRDGILVARRVEP